MTGVLFWVFMAYDALVVATGLFIPSRIAGLLACALGNAPIVSYPAFAAGRLGSLFSMGICYVR
jgi:hypothetical protein